MNEFIKPRQRFINAVTNKPVDINRLMLLLSARKPLENLPMAYVKNSTEPIIPNSVSEKIPSSTIGFYDDVLAQPAYIVHAVSKGCCLALS